MKLDKLIEQLSAISKQGAGNLSVMVSVETDDSIAIGEIGEISIEQDHTSEEWFVRITGDADE